MEGLLRTIVLWITIICSLILSTFAFSCGKTSLTASSGTITSPGYPSNYPSSISCSYRITVSSSRRIELTWDTFDVYGYMPYCNEDKDGYVAVYTGCGLSGYLISKFCSTNSGKPHKIYTKDNCLTIKFSSNGKTAKGFRARYTSVSKNTPVSTKQCKDDQEINYIDQGVVMSTNWPKPYPSHKFECEWELRTSSSKVFKLNFMDIDTTKKSIFSWCQGSDYVKIKGKDSRYTSSENKKYYCGEKKPFSLTTRYYRLDVDFKTTYGHGDDSRGFAMGFITYEPKETIYTVFSKVAIAAIVVGIVAVVVCIICGVRWYKRRRATPTPFVANYAPQPKEPEYVQNVPGPAPPPYSAVGAPGYQAYPGYPAPAQPPPPGNYPPTSMASQGMGYADPGYPVGAPYPGGPTYPPGAPPPTEKQPLNPAASAPDAYTSGATAAPYYPTAAGAAYGPPSQAPPPAGHPPPY